jgi:uncharacterized protein (DUF39 family)
MNPWNPYAIPGVDQNGPMGRYMLYTIYDSESPAFRATFAIPMPVTKESVLEGIARKESEFAAAKQS